MSRYLPWTLDFQDGSMRAVCLYLLIRGLVLPLPSECLFLDCLFFFEQLFELTFSAPANPTAVAVAVADPVVGIVMVVFQLCAVPYVGNAVALISVDAPVGVATPRPA